MAYHINPQTGNPGVCRAKKTCPFGDLESEHFPDRETARAHYEKLMESRGQWSEGLLQRLPEGARIVEFGSTDPRSSQLKARGFDPIAVVGSEEEAQQLRETGANARFLDPTSDPIPYCDAVMVHDLALGSAQAEGFFHRIGDSIPEDGTLTLRVSSTIWAHEAYRDSLVRAGFSEFTVQEEGDTLTVQAIKVPKVDSYLGSHQPSEDGALAHEVDSHYPDFYEHPEYYMFNSPAYRESARILKSLRGKPEADVTIYRAVPPEASGQIHPGNWVTLSKSYAETHAMQWEEGAEDWEVISLVVKAKELRTPGDDINEFGWYPTES